MSIETNPRLWQDPVWSALARADQALVSQPWILFEKVPSWDKGLNIDEINALCREAGFGNKPVFEVRIEKEFERPARRVLVVHHYLAPISVEVVTWPQWIIQPSQAPVDQIREYLASWLNERARVVLRTSRKKPAIEHASIGLPEGTKWSDLTIRFLSETDIKVETKGYVREWNARSLGMTDARTDRPLKQWELLQTLAKGDGVYSWSTLTARGRWDKQRSELAISLRRNFGLEGDPIVAIRGSWRCAFKLVPCSDWCR
ncbi:MAG: hypothetical protein KF757_14045 [Phycisphaeraceae bacterium]|nr:hypothetical protein [Phycisphaeraceae bacterium]MCW5763630.1 hypothetical protein [Phycisphaeraceae bacterium]